MFLIKPYFVQPSGAITRASTATYTDATGVLRYAAINEIRPIIEETGSTNIVLYSNDAAQYNVVGDLTESTSQGPDGLATSAIRLTTTKTTTEERYAESAGTNLVSFASNKTYAFSVYVKNIANVTHARLYTSVNGGAYVQFRFSTKSLSLSSGIVPGSFYAESLADGWVRIGFKVLATTSLNNNVLRVYLCNNGVNVNYIPTTTTDSLSYFGFQVEEGNISSYIPTTETPVSRAPDIVPPQPAGTTALLNSSVPVNDYPEWSSGTAYTIGQRVVVSASSIYIYEAIAASTGVNPTTDTTGKWLNIGAVNRWRMFDSYLSTSTVSVDGDISVTLRPGASIDSIGLMNLKAKTVRVIVTDEIEGEVVNRFYDLYTSSLSESNWYTYFFETPTNSKKIFVIDDLPRTGTAIVTVQLSNAGLTTECGLLVLGRKQVIGKGVEYGTTSGISDYSVKTTDQFGNVNVVERAYADRLNYRVFLDSSEDFSVKNILASVRATPCLYVGNKDLQSTITYGYFKNFDIALQSPTYSDYNLEIEGLT